MAECWSVGLFRHNNGWIFGGYVELATSRFKTNFQLLVSFLCVHMHIYLLMCPWVNFLNHSLRSSTNQTYWSDRQPTGHFFCEIADRNGQLEAIRWYAELKILTGLTNAGRVGLWDPDNEDAKAHRRSKLLWYFDIAMENHNFQWVNPLWMAISNSYVKLSEGILFH